MVSPTSTPHNCGSPGCTRRGQVEGYRGHYCGSPGCTRRGQPEYYGQGGMGEAYANMNRQPPKGEPNPSNYKIEMCKVIGSCTIVKVRYSDCDNYEGLKILVLKDDQTLNLLNKTTLDPHFTKDSTLIARFHPTPQGLLMAETFAVHWSKTLNGR